MSIAETIRGDQFCQMKSEIRGSSEYLIVGSDVAKDRHHAFMGSATGKSLLRKLFFENNSEGFGKLLDRSAAVKAQNACETGCQNVENSVDDNAALSILNRAGNLVMITEMNRSARKGRALYFLTSQHVKTLKIFISRLPPG